jgi:predicted ATPase
MATVHKKPESERLDDHTAPPFLHRVRIRGYKSIAFCDVQLAPLTVLVGRNGSGKSNFLDALAFLRDVMKVGVAEAVKIRSRGGWSALVCRSSDTPKIEIEIESIFTCGSPFRRIRDNTGPSATLPPDAGQLPDFTGVTFTARYSLEFSAGPQLAPVISRERLDIADESRRLRGGFVAHDGIVEQWGIETDFAYPLEHPRERIHPLLHRPDFPLLSVIGTQPLVELGMGLRWMAFYNFIPDVMRALPFPTAGELLDKHGQNLPSVIEGLKELEPESVQRVRAYLRVIVGEIEDFDVTHLGEYETVRFRLRGDAGARRLEFDAASMSDGTLRALAALMAAFQVVLPHGYPSVVGIEEPETSLHPAAMRALVDALDEATGRTQVLLTTHSAELLDNPTIGPDSVRIVEMIDGKTVITPIDEASREILRRKLNTLGELERQDRLETDPDDVERQQRLSRSAQGPAA